MVEAVILPRSQKRKRLSMGVNGSIKRKGCHGKAVRFNPDNSEWTALNYFAGLDASAEEKLRADLWYTSRDFEQFMEDRVQTMRVWRAVGGNSRLMEPNYSLRGLESFQSTLMDGELQFLRSRHLAAVLKEQERLRSCAGPSHPDSLAKVSLQHSSWAVDRAVRLGIKDSVDATAYQMDKPPTPTAALMHPMLKTHSMSTMSSMYAKAPHMIAAPTASMSLRQLMPQLSSSHASAASRESLAKMSSGLAPSFEGFSGHCTSRNVVNIPMLKRLNKEFLLGLGKTGGGGGCLLFATPAQSNGHSMGTLDLLTEALNATSDNSPSYRFG
ncbi:hypothetical protein ACA910_004567 [Epithemia clementina (nom. ined.)]